MVDDETWVQYSTAANLCYSHCLSIVSLSPLLLSLLLCRQYTTLATSKKEVLSFKKEKQQQQKKKKEKVVLAWAHILKSHSQQTFHSEQLDPLLQPSSKVSLVQHLKYWDMSSQNKVGLLLLLLVQNQ